jgi:hypothetical protein
MAAKADPEVLPPAGFDALRQLDVDVAATVSEKCQEVEVQNTGHDQHSASNSNELAVTAGTAGVGGATGDDPAVVVEIVHNSGHDVASATKPPAVAAAATGRDGAEMAAANDPEVPPPVGYDALRQLDTDLAAVVSEMCQEVDEGSWPWHSFLLPQHLSKHELETDASSAQEWHAFMAAAGTATAAEDMRH